MSKSISYEEGYKYQLAEDYTDFVAVHPDTEIDHEFFNLKPDGWLTIRKGYAWDGPSGPTIDTKTFMRGSLVHDVLYQMMREGYIGQEYFHIANEELHRICLEDGMWSIRAWWVFQGVEKFGKQYCKPQPDKILTAP